MEISKVELLSCNNLTENKQILSDIDLLRKALFKEIGWHYYVDLIWVVNNLRASGIGPGSLVLDAGAGNGLLQYLLAMYGYNVISVDFSPRTISPIIKPIFKIEKKESGMVFNNPYISHISESNSLKIRLQKTWLLLRKGNISFSSYFKLHQIIMNSKLKQGSILFYQADLQNMKEIMDDSVDAIVSVSAIEHMEVKSILLAVNEFNRVLKKEHPIILTTSASKSNDWFHQPSEGWCFSKKTLASLFHINCIGSAEFTNYDELLSEYRTNEFLKFNLAKIYSVSENNGMPNGIWDPQYLPVGIVTNSLKKLPEGYR